jgi:hypothetical protein
MSCPIREWPLPGSPIRLNDLDYLTLAARKCQTRRPLPYDSGSVARSVLLPAAVLLLFGVGFAGGTLGRGLPAFDDHPGQLYRLAHAVDHGLAPWTRNPGWWAGYAELQYYPPGFAYLGALLHRAALGAIGVEATYHALLWAVYLLPGLGTYALLARILPSPWLALPGAFLALTLSAGARSGVEEGLRWGLVAARLGWGLLPLLGLALVREAEGGRPRLVAPALLLAAIVLAHPAHLAAGICLIALAAVVSGAPPGRALLRAAAVVVLGLALAGFWLLPLLGRLELVRPLAWSGASLWSLLAAMGRQPLLVALAAASALGWRAARGLPLGRARTFRWLAALPPAMLALVALDALGLEPVGLGWLPADRLQDGLFLYLILGAAPVLARLARAPVGLPPVGLAAAGVAAAIGLGLIPSAEPTLSLRSGGPRDWPTLAELDRGLRLDALWEALAAAPPGRILFVRSGVPLQHGRDWWRPHSHVTALAPLRSGREIVHGTFTHPSPLASVVYRGPGARGPVTVLAEERDGRTLFGEALERLTPDVFERLAEALRVSAVVSLDEDAGRLAFLTDGGRWVPFRQAGPFRVWAAVTPRALPAPVARGRWRVEAGPHPGGWLAAGVAYSPLFEARRDTERLPTRADALGMLEVRVPAGAEVVLELSYGPGALEWAGIGLTGAALLGAGILARRARP